MIDFVGAGPGAADLITVRGKRLIEEADVIIYAGSLVNPELLDHAKKEAKIYNSATMTLEEVTEVMLTENAAGKKIVRLHTGDQSIYGAVREQMDILDKNGVKYASTPGVSACFGAAASLDIEYTLPGITQTLIITRMEGATPVPEKESIEKLASHNASMAIYLSAGMLDELARRLIAGGYQKDTPAVLAYKATHPDEKIFVCTLGDLADVARKNDITRTAIVLVGDAVAHASFDRSKLYDPDFSTMYRKASHDNG
ncbi:MAG: precorrin-4 C(11)-methyltransferase [Lachnospiraceae bacterium]|nr:precorrin-4 C(11)-methyltransferase [Lachnospiraceae bacterium]